MGGGDLNMKKSWHPLLLKNQERVWLEEKKALEEKKKLDQLRKEKEEERQLQELQRLQEEQTGKKRTEKLEWMYATPATGSSTNANDLEDYLLGKKRVDKILTADENAKLGAAHKNFIAVQNANNTRDIAAKIREDPLLAIKQQEQAAYEALMKNPLRLREMQERNGIKPKKDKKEKKREKEERKRLKHERKHRKERDSRSQPRSPSPGDRQLDYRHSASPDRYARSRRSRSPYSRRSRSPGPSHSRYSDDRGRYRDDYSPPRRIIDRDYPARSRGEPLDERRANGGGRIRASPSYDRKRTRSPSPHYDERSPYSKRSRVERSRSSPPPPRPSNGNGRDSDNAADDRAARLAAMSNNAVSMNIERQKRLAAMLEKEKEELAEEERKRAKSGGMGSFLGAEQKKVFGGVGGLEDRIRRGRGGMVVDAD